jgi:hypothetical protein
MAGVDALLLGFLISVPGLTVAAIGFALLRLWQRRRRLALVMAQSCKGCGEPFEDALAEYLGAPPPEELARMDRFQRRFAVFQVRCMGCGALNTCTADGTPYRARYAEG